MSGIEALEFSMVKLKLQDLDEGPGWTLERCEAAEVEYKRFLALKRAYPDFDLVPLRDVDIFWHQHILDTAKYEEDCQSVFGEFLHHYPYFGMNGPEDHADLCAASKRSQALHALHFADGEGEVVLHASKCRTKCKPMKCK